MQLTAALAAALGVSWASGMNLYAAVAVLGFMHHFGGVELPGDLAVTAHPAVLILATVMYLIEFVADKVPYVDTVWDVVHTFIRVPAGAALAAASFADYGPVAETIFVLLGGGLALSSHSSKAATRVAVNMSPEPVSNSLVSLGEDGLVFGLVALAIFHPVLAILAMMGIIALTIYLLPKIIRLLLVAFGKIKRFLTGSGPVTGEVVGETIVTVVVDSIIE